MLYSPILYSTCNKFSTLPMSEPVYEDKHHFFVPDSLEAISVDRSSAEGTGCIYSHPGTFVKASVKVSVSPFFLAPWFVQCWMLSTGYILSRRDALSASEIGR